MPVPEKRRFFSGRIRAKIPRGIMGPHNLREIMLDPPAPLPCSRGATWFRCGDSPGAILAAQIRPEIRGITFRSPRIARAKHLIGPQFHRLIQDALAGGLRLANRQQTVQNHVHSLLQIYFRRLNRFEGPRFLLPFRGWARKAREGFQRQFLNVTMSIETGVPF